MTGYPVSADNVSYSYNLLGRRLTATGAAAADNVSYAWDNAGRLASTMANGRTLSYQYDAAGNRTRTTWPDTAGACQGSCRLRQCMRGFSGFLLLLMELERLMMKEVNSNCSTWLMNAYC